MFAPDLIDRATYLLAQMRARQLLLATAESCTGGLIAGLFTEISGSSDVVDRGFVTYSNEAKADMLGVPVSKIAVHGAVSREVAQLMAEGALKRIKANAPGITVAVTGVAGPGGGTAAKPVGLVHIAVARTGRTTRHLECRFGAIGRGAVRLATIAAALDQMEAALTT
jgi:nicotinamide-nucleotide amidase